MSLGVPLDKGIKSPLADGGAKAMLFVCRCVHGGNKGAFAHAVLFDADLKHGVVVYRTKLKGHIYWIN